MAGVPTSISIWLAAALAALCNAGAQVLMKHASSGSTTESEQLSSELLGVWGFNPIALFFAALLYLVSFFTTAWVYSRLPLSVASPLMAAAIFVLISFASTFIFSESVGALKLLGMFCMVLGIFLILMS